MKKFKIDYFLCLSLILLCLLVFPNLSNQYLWQDEAENAIIARNILSYGYPRAFDGNLLVVSDIGYRKDFTWICQPHLQNYVTALSFYILGQSTFSARLPFAIFGIFSFIAAYVLAERLFSARVAKIASLILATSVPFLLMIRQSRYYSLALFFALILIHSYLDYVEKKRFAAIKILVSGSLLFNSNFGLFFPMFLGLGFHYVLFYFKPENIKRDIGLLSLIIVTSVPVFIYFKGWMHEDPLSLKLIMSNLNFYLRSINRYIVPIRFIFIVYFILAILKRKLVFFRISDANKRNVALIFSIFLMAIFSLGLAKSCRLRYVIHLIPLLIIFESYILARWTDYNKILPAICLVLLVTTDLFHHSLDDFFIKPLSTVVASIDKKYPAIAENNKITAKIVEKAKEDAGKKIVVTSLLKEYIYEITHDYDGPVECIVEFLNEYAKKTDTVKIPYGDCAVAFYTGLKVDNKMEPGENPYPEWIIPRDYWTPADFYNSDYYKEIEKKYEKIVLDCPDLMWENRPDDLGYHKFRTVKDYPKKVIIYKRGDINRQ